MKKRNNWVIGLFLFWLSICSLFVVQEAKATSKTQGEAIDWVKSKINQAIDADGAYGAQCVDLVRAYYNYLGVSQVAGNGCDYATNALPSGWTRIKGAQPQKGDVLVYTGGYGHVAIYESDSVTYHQNYNGKQYVTRETFAYNSPGYITNYTPYWGVIRPNWATSSADKSAPTISNISITNVTKDGYTVSCTVSDNVGVTSVKFPSWNADKHKGEDAVWITGTISGNTASARINIANLKSGAVEGWYMTHIYAYDAAGNSKATSTIRYIDRTAPKIKNAKVLFKDCYGYYVECEIEDKSPIAYVEYPTWTSSNGQDDLASTWPRGYTHNGKYRYRVNVSAHNNEYGAYNTHIYAHDSYGNYSSSSVGTVMTKEVIPFAMEVWNNTLYVGINESMQWAGAKAFAENMGGQLVSITSQEETNALSELCSNAKEVYYYTAGLRDTLETPFYWFTKELMSYTNWESDEPNNLSGIEYYIALVGGTKAEWCDLRGDHDKSGLVAEISLDLKPIKTICVGEKSYELYDVQMPWHAAKKFSEAKNGHLVTITSETEAKVIEDLVNDYQGSNIGFYIGASDTNTEGTFEWITGEGVNTSFINWRSGEPNNSSAAGGQDYIGVGSDGTYDDVNASGKLGFILEKDIIVEDAISDKKETDNNNYQLVVDTTKENDKNNGKFSLTEKDNAKDINSKGLNRVIIKSVKNKKKKTVKITWKKVKGAKKYQIQYSRNKKFKKKKTRLVKGTKATIKKLKKKKYYIRVRAYKKVGKKKVYGKWSKVKVIKIKK